MKMMTTKFDLLTAMDRLHKALGNAWLDYAGYNADEIYSKHVEINLLQARVLNELPMTESSNCYNDTVFSCKNAQKSADQWPRSKASFEDIMIDTHVVINDVNNLLSEFGTNVYMANAYEYTGEYKKASRIWDEYLTQAQDEGNVNMIRISSMSLLRLHKRSGNIEGPSPQILHKTIALAELKY